MTDNVKGLDFAGVKVRMSTGTRLVKLITPSSAVNISYHDAVTNANYQVPVGKKFTVIHLEIYQGRINTRMSSTTVADSPTGAVTLLETFTNTQIDDEIFISSEVAAALFITTTNVNMNGALTEIWGIEEDV